MGSLSIGHWLIVLVIVVLVFGTKRLKNVGKDLGEAIKGFKQGVHDGDSADADKPAARLSDDTRRDDPAARKESDVHDNEQTPR